LSTRISEMAWAIFLYVHSPTPLISKNNFSKPGTKKKVYVCLSFSSHMRKTLEAKSSLYTRNEGYIEPVLNL